jgi:nucleotide-binding universal stress UspA family protein
MKKILVPCDFSESAIGAFRFAIDIAGKSEGEIILLHVIELAAMYDTTLMPALSFEDAYLKDAKDNAEKNFDKLITKWAKDSPPVRGQVQYGITATTINEFAKESKVDLIVMGTKGASGFKEIMVGSNTEKIVRSSLVPVLALKKYVKNPIHNIVFPNALVEEQEQLVKKVKALQNFFGATLHIVYINTPAQFHSDRDTKQKLNAFAKRYLFKDYTINIYNDRDQESGLINFTNEIKADMVAMGTHGRMGLAHIVSGSITEDVVNHIECPIWTFKI